MKRPENSLEKFSTTHLLFFPSNPTIPGVFAKNFLTKDNVVNVRQKNYNMEQEKRKK